MSTVPIEANKTSVVAAPAQSRADQSSTRLAFLDNLRVALMIWVIAHHVGQAYGPTGGAWLIQEPTRAPVLGPFFTVNRSFGMSLFFLIAGYFMVRSCDAKGSIAFLKSRLLRLGVPREQPDRKESSTMWWLDLLWGLWNGLTAWIVFLVHLFGGWEHFAIYNVARSGNWYDFGFLLGAGSPFLGAFSGRNRIVTNAGGQHKRSAYGESIDQ